MTKKKLTQIAGKINACQNCSLYKTATRPVPGHGSSEAEIFFVGEAPGYHEDRQGIPFCGNSGKLLDKLLARIGLARQKVFIANILKHRPPANRDPQPEEINACVPFLRQQLLAVKPKLVVTLGRFAMSFFLPGEYISQVHGQAKTIDWEGIKLILYPVYHPAAALRRNQFLADLAADFDKIPPLLSSARSSKDSQNKKFKQKQLF